MHVSRLARRGKNREREPGIFYSRRFGGSFRAESWIKGWMQIKQATIQTLGGRLADTMAL